MALCKTKKIKALLGLVPTSLIVMGTGIGLATSIHHNNSKPVVFNNTTVSAMKAAMKSKMVSDGTPVAIDTLVPENSNVGNFINPTPDSANILDKLIVWAFNQNITIDTDQLEVTTQTNTTATITAADWAVDYVVGSTTVIDFTIGSPKPVADLFNTPDYVPPTLNEVNPSQPQIITAMVQADPQLKDVIWSDLGIQYVGNGIIDVKANPQSTNYTGEADVNVATEIDPSSANPTLSNVGDTVLITAELGQLDSSSYVWNYNIPTWAISYINVVKNYNAQTISFTLVKSWDSTQGGFDVSLLLNGQATSNSIHITTNGSEVYSYFTWSNNTITGLTTLGSSQTNITIPDSYNGVNITDIPGRLFENDTTIQSVTLNQFINNVNTAAFHNCPNLKIITVNNANTFFNTNSLDTKTSTTLKISDTCLGWLNNGSALLNINGQVRPTITYDQTLDGYYEYCPKISNTSATPITCTSAFDVYESASSLSNLQSLATTRITIQASSSSTTVQNAINAHIVGTWKDTNTQIAWLKNMQCSGNEEQHWGDSTDTRTDYNGFYGNCIYGYKNYGILATGASYTFLSYNKNVSWSTGSTWTDHGSNGRDFCMMYWGERWANDDGSSASGAMVYTNWWHTQEIDVNGKTTWTGWEHTGGNGRIQDGQASLFGW